VSRVERLTCCHLSIITFVFVVASFFPSFRSVRLSWGSSPVSSASGIMGTKVPAIPVPPERDSNVTGCEDTSSAVRPELAGCEIQKIHN